MKLFKNALICCGLIAFFSSITIAGSNNNGASSELDLCQFDWSKLTKEEARIKSEDFLWQTKMRERNCMKLVTEYFENIDDPSLKITENTFICLNR